MNKLFTIILAIVLSLPISVWAVDNTAPNNDATSVVNTLDEDIVEDNAKNEAESIYKQPLSKRKIAKKFLAAMGGVGISSLALYFLLTLYNRIREGYTCRTKDSDDEVSLETPDDLNSAVRAFLDKTDWKG